MKIEFECTGGIANLHLHHETQLENLPPQEADQLASLVKQANLPDVKPTGEDTGADAFSYKLTVEDDADKHTVSVTDVTAPDELRPLLDHLRNLAVKEKLKK